ncbi:hypothetical protein DFS33DRAFT_1273405 [Desarmillaria ectypa]|nr:hypothetical protein DFS33DRAFT_1273405 [Desarmillaria ectypa]
MARRTNRISVSIDGADAYVASCPSQGEYMQWYISPTLEEGDHAITPTEMDNTDVDYATVGVGNQTTALVIVSSGPETGRQYEYPHITKIYVDNHPLGNSMKNSRTVGESFFSFQFIGTNVSEFRIQGNSIVGVISADFSVDEEKTSTRSGNDIATTMFFLSPILNSGIRTLIMDITEVAGDQSLMLDYITYPDQVSNGNSSSSSSSSSGSSSPNSPSGSSSSYS